MIRQEKAVSCADCRTRIGSPVAPFEAGPNLITDFFTPTYLCWLVDALVSPLKFRGTDWWQVAGSSCQGHASTTSRLVGLFCRRFHSDAGCSVVRSSQPLEPAAHSPLNKTILFESEQSCPGLDQVHVLGFDLEYEIFIYMIILVRLENFN